MSYMTHFKSPLDAEVVKHGRRYGYLVHFVNEVIKYDSVKHITIEVPGLHASKTLAGGGREIVHDHNCLRCEIEKAIEHANRDGWVGLEWEGGVEPS